MAVVGVFFYVQQKRRWVSLSDLKSWHLGAKALSPKDYKRAEALLNRTPSPCQPDFNVLVCLKKKLPCWHICEAEALIAIAAIRQKKSNLAVQALLDHAASHWTGDHLPP